MNPSVSFAMFLTGRLNLLKLLVYILAQFIGAFLGALIVFLVYYDGIKNFKTGMHSLDTAGIFATYPNPTVSSLSALVDQVVGTALLVMVVLALNDPKNAKIAAVVEPLSVGFAIVVINLAYGYNTGCAVNPTRDFAPRLFTLIAGWGTQTFTSGNYFFWIPIVGPLVGSFLATLIHSLVTQTFVDS